MTQPDEYHGEWSERRGEEKGGRNPSQEVEGAVAYSVWDKEEAEDGAAGAEFVEDPDSETPQVEQNSDGGHPAVNAFAESVNQLEE